MYSSLFFSNKFISFKHISFAIDLPLESFLFISSPDTWTVNKFLFPASNLPYLSFISPLGAFIKSCLYVLFSANSV